MTLKASSIFRTEKASRYLQQLCKHFGHKVEVKFTPTHGNIELPMGGCQLDASTGNNLEILVSANDEADLEKTKDVIAKHLERFAFREEFSLKWND